jgi:hypothetical protein
MMENSCPTFFAMEKGFMFLIWARSPFQSLKTVILLRKCRQAAVPREEGGPKIFITRRMKLFA